MSSFAFLERFPLRRAVGWARSQVTARLLLAVILPGLPFCIFRQLLHLRLGLVNVDYLLAVLLVVAGYRRWASGVFVVTYLMECVRLLDAVYYFSQQDLLFAAHFLKELPFVLVLRWVAGVALLCYCNLKLWLALIPRIRENAVKALAPTVLLIVSCCLVDFIQGYGPLFKDSRLASHYHLANEILFRAPLAFVHGQGPEPQPTVLLHSATDPLWSAQAGIPTKRENVVIVVVESMGLLRDTEGNDREFSRIVDDADVKKQYSIATGSVPFTGGTVVGEMRELCHLKTGIHIEQETTLKGQQDCLPRQFQKAGYETAAYHGYRNTMFQRSEWYPKLGFQETRFLGQFGSLPMCNGVFYGVCDDAIASLISQRLQNKTAQGALPQFLYWMTLNGHLPVDADHAPVKPCPIVADREVCAQLSYVEQVLDSVKELALKPGIGPTTIVVVGDHAPPYGLVARRNLFDDHEVPFLVLRPLS